MAEPRAMTERHKSAPKREVPLRFDMPGLAVTLGQAEYHLAVHTTAGAVAIQKYIDTSQMPVMNSIPDDTVGMALVSGAIGMDKFETLQGLLKHAIFEEIPDDLVYEATPEQLIQCVDTLFNQTGLEWLNRILKNSLERMGAMIGASIEQEMLKRQQVAEQRIAELLATESETNSSTGTESPQPASIASS